jgi:hypothetical protein
MTIIDYILLGGFAAAVLYTGYRLFLGWLRTPSDEIESEISNIPKRSTIEPTARERGLAQAGASEIADMSSQLR